MLKPTAVIIDDELSNIELLNHFLQKYCPQISVVGYACTKTDAVTLIQNVTPDIIFLDVLLDTGTGFEILEELPEISSRVIFITAFDNFALKAFEYSAVDYIVKPVDIERLIDAVEKAVKHIENNQFTTITQVKSTEKKLKQQKPLRLTLVAIPSIDKIDFIDPNEIIYLESNRKYTVFHLKNGDQLVAAKNIGWYEDTIDPQTFFRIHKSYIINLQYIISINKSGGNYCELIGGKSLPIAKRRRKELQNFLKI